MTRHCCSSRRLGSRTVILICLATLSAVARSAVGAQEAPAPAPRDLVAPAAESLRAYDRPSDDGSAIVLEWELPASNYDRIFPHQFAKMLVPRPKDASPAEFAFRWLTSPRPLREMADPAAFAKPWLASLRWTRSVVRVRQLAPRDAEAPAGEAASFVLRWLTPLETTRPAASVVEVARAEEDFEKGDLETARPPAAMKSDKPKYFGFAKRNRTLQFAVIEPAALFPPKPTVSLSVAELRRLKIEPRWLHAAAGALQSKQQGFQDVLRPAAPLTVGELRRLSVTGRWLLVSAAIFREHQREHRSASRERLKRLLAHWEKENKSRLKAERLAINAQTYYCRLAISDGAEQKVYVSRDGTPVVVQARARANTFKGFKLNNLVFALVFSGIVLAFIQAARRNPNLFIRKIAGLEAVEEAIGRATEMGRPVFFVHGLGGIGSLATIAAVNILARVARRAAEYDTRIRVMNNNPIVTAVSQEVVQQAYTEAGRPDAYDADDVSLVASDQFSYAAAVGGRMVREQPAAIFLIGSFAAESLLLAETGASTGAIQVAGTDSYTQLPFFITTCDYTLIGEELYAASAYLSHEPRMLGSLRGQDIGKAFLMLAIVGGVVTLTVSVALGVDASWLRNLLQAF